MTGLVRVRVWLLTLVAALALGAPAAAQVVGTPQSITVVDSGTACVTAPTACAIYSLDSSTGSLTLGVFGTWTGTLTFEGTNNGDTWTSVLATNVATGVSASTTTANGLFTITNIGVVRIRARATAAITGTANVTAAKGIGFARSLASSFNTVCFSALTQDTYLSEVGTNNLGFYSGATNCASGTLRMDYNGTRLNLSSGYALQFNAGAGLYDGGANVIEQRNATNAQTFRVYGNASSAKYGEITSDGTNMLLNSVGGHMYFGSAGTYRWLINSSTGHLLANIDNTYDIGASGATRPRDYYGAGNITVGGTVTSGAGTTAIPSQLVTHGTLLTTATADAVENDATAFYNTVDTTNGRRYSDGWNYFRLTGSGGGITTIADFFGTNDGIPLVANGVYEIEWHCYFSQATAGTATWTIVTATTALATLTGEYIGSNIAGIGTVGAPQTAAINTTASSATAFPVTGTEATGTTHEFTVRAMVTAGNGASNTRLKLTMGTGTATPLINSYFRVRRLPAGNTGTFVS